MFNKIIAVLTLVPVGVIIAMLYDLKADRWEWKDKHRYWFIVAGAIVDLYLVKRTTIIWPHVVTAILALFFMTQAVRSWRQHKKIGGTFTLPQLGAKVGTILASVYVFYVVVTRILMIKGIHF